ncbi:MAG: VOC family protein [Hyphomicrobiales bacterium]
MNYYSSVIFVRDIELSRRFYTELLGCKVEYDMNPYITFNNGLAIWQLPTDHVIYKNTRDNNNSVRMELYFETADIEDKYKMLQKSNIRFLHELELEPWGQYTMRFFDPDGHLIEVGEPIDVYIQRMHNEGQSCEDISRQTGMEVEGIKNILKK